MGEFVAQIEPETKTIVDCNKFFVLAVSPNSILSFIVKNE